jgi:hypothetical protein
MDFEVLEVVNNIRGECANDEKGQLSFFLPKENLPRLVLQFANRPERRRRGTEIVTALHNLVTLKDIRHRVYLPICLPFRSIEAIFCFRPPSFSFTVD